MTDEIETLDRLQYYVGTLKTSGNMVGLVVPKWFQRLMMQLEAHDNEALYLKIRIQNDDPITLENFKRKAVLNSESWIKMIVILNANGRVLVDDEIMFTSSQLDKADRMQSYIKKALHNLVVKMVINFTRYERTGNTNNQAFLGEGKSGPVGRIESKENAAESEQNTGSSEANPNSEGLAESETREGFGPHGSGH